MLFFFYTLLQIFVFVYLLVKLTFRPCYSKVCMVGKTVLVTGGSKGVGLSTSLCLASRGCRVIIGCRSNCDQVKAKIIAETGNPNIVVKHLDLQSLESVRKFAKEINETEKKLDVLINNAGIGVSVSNQHTKDGLHPLMQANYFGHFLLTHLLTDLLKKSAPSRVIFVGSELCVFSNLSVDNLNYAEGACKEEKYLGIVPENYTRSLRIYSNSKAAMLIMSNELARRLKKNKITSNTVHPGVVATAIFESIDNICQSRAIIPNLVNTVVLFFFNIYSKSTDEGAQPSVRVAVAKEYETITGKYEWDFSWLPSPSVAKNENLCCQIWDKTEELVKLQPNEKIPKVY